MQSSRNGAKLLQRKTRRVDDDVLDRPTTERRRVYGDSMKIDQRHRTGAFLNDEWTKCGARTLEEVGTLDDGANGPWPGPGTFSAVKTVPHDLDLLGSFETSTHKSGQGRSGRIKGRSQPILRHPLYLSRGRCFGPSIPIRRDWRHCERHDRTSRALVGAWKRPLESPVDQAEREDEQLSSSPIVCLAWAAWRDARPPYKESLPAPWSEVSNPIRSLVRVAVLGSDHFFWDAYSVCYQSRKFTRSFRDP
nr:hypothetical protein CFP56_54526 [Quercus suber]